MSVRIIGVLTILAGSTFAVLRLDAVDPTSWETMFSSVVFGGVLAGAVLALLGLHATVVGPHPDAAIRARNRRAGLAGLALGIGCVAAFAMIEWLAMYDTSPIGLLLLGGIGLLAGFPMFVTGRALNE